MPIERDLLSDLTEPQRLAVTTTQGPLLVLAAAGSGKTRVITRRAAYLVLHCGVAPWQVCAITFTNKAAGEMRHRMAELLSERQARAVMIGTFHSLCVRILRQYGASIRVANNFVIYDSADQRSVIKKALKALNLNETNFAPAEVHSQISNAKNKLVDAAAYAKGADDWYHRKIADVFAAYQKELKKSNALDFDDLLLKTAELLEKDEAARTELQDRYHYLLVDEYQDTNHAQFVIAFSLSEKHRNICAVGDPDQSIYGWRGATLTNIMEFETHFPDAKVIQLGQNYRSTPQILAAADSLIKHNRRRRDKPLFTENQAGGNVRVIHASNEEHEAELVMQWLSRQRASGLNWSQMAVFYRINALSRVLETALRDASIPYQVARGTAFYQRKEIKDALAYLRVLSNPEDEVNLERIVNTPPRGIGQTTVDHLSAYATANGLSLYEATSRALHVPALTGRGGAAVAKFVNLIDKWRKKITTYDEQALGFVPGMRDVIEMVIRDSTLEEYYKSPKTGDEEKLANLYELVTAGQRFDDTYEREDATLEQRLQDYLEAVSLVSDVDGVSDGGGMVTLMTLHAAKGLEFDAVAIVGLEDGLLPHSRARDDASELEEERRLCFVGMTRAMRSLLLTHARYRTVRGLRERTVASPFLRELNPSVVEVEDRSMERDEWSGPSGTGTYGRGGSGAAWDRRGGGGEARRPAASEQPAPRPVEAARTANGIEVGVLVKHPQFGLGRVMTLTPASAPTRAKVYFQGVGAKTLVLEHTNLVVMNESDL